MKKTYQITEYASFVREKVLPGYISLPVRTFDALESFLLANSIANGDTLDVMSISVRKGAGKVITAKNYVGVITMDDGTTIEILPKIYSNEAFSEVQVKKLLIDMLTTLRDAPFKALKATNVDVDKLNIFEIFIRMFIDEVFLIAKRGLKCNYVAVQSNERFFRGKLVAAEHIKHNYAHKERSFVEYDEFNTNRPENRILKSTLSYLYKRTASFKNKADIRTLLAVFSDVEESSDYRVDFDRIVPDRRTADYQTALLWSKVFLRGKSFTSFSGSEVAAALLFPMETLFESYVAAKLRKVLGGEYTLTTQDRTHYLFDEPRRFLLKPDIAVRNKTSGQVYIIDTKWKLLDASKSNYSISQADMYQMYAYNNKYKSESVTLLYPLTERVASAERINFRAQDGTLVRVRFVDLLDVKHLLDAIVEEITEVN